MLMCNVGLSPCNVYIVVLNIIYDYILENLPFKHIDQISVF